MAKLIGDSKFAVSKCTPRVPVDLHRASEGADGIISLINPIKRQRGEETPFRLRPREGKLSFDTTTFSQLCLDAT